MKKLNIPFLFVLIFVFSVSCSELEDIAGEAASTIETGDDTDPLTNEEVIKGLKEALEVGTKNSVDIASATDGFYQNPSIKIPFPPEAQKVKEKAIELGMEERVDKFVLTLNRAAEEASKEAAPVFVDAIKGMTVKDGFEILNGDEHAATKYLERKTTPELKTKFQPIVSNAIKKVDVTKHWTPIITTYNKIPLVEKINPDLEDYVTGKAIEGLFHLISKEEEKIRENPQARVTDLLKRVFGDQG